MRICLRYAAFRLFVKGISNLYPKTRTRTDYSAYYSTPHASSLAWRVHSHRWMKPLMWVALGFMVGIIYSKLLLTPRHETLALANSEKALVLPKEAKSQDKATKSSKA